MDPLRLIAATKGVFLTQEALELGYSEKAITRSVRGGLWHRVRRGAYVPIDMWKGADEVGRHFIVASAIHRSYGDRVAFSHTTAALMHGIAVWGVDLSKVHVMRVERGAGRIERDVVHHEPLEQVRAELVRVDGRLVVPPVRAALQLGMVASTESALVTLDSILFKGLATPSELGTAFDEMQRWPNSQHLQIALRMADARAESPGESRSRWMFRCAGIPAPELQYAVFDADGKFLGRSDFAWRSRRMLGEFDGRMKYGRLLKPGEQPGEAVFREKVREDAMRAATGFGMFRLIWFDVDHPADTCRRLRRLLDAAA